MCKEPYDRRWMLRALSLAARGEGLVEPNPMVGAVIVREGQVLGEGWHRRLGDPHAEIEALREADRRTNDTRDATMYVTLEPCVHHGKTPPCAPELVNAGLRRVVIAVEDPLWEDHARSQPGGNGGRRGITLLREAGVEVSVGCGRAEAVMLNAAFFKAGGSGLPLVTAKWAMSADGKIATHTGSSQWISGEASRHSVHELRGRVDAVIVGGGTAQTDDPLLTCRDAERRRVAVRVVMCGRRLPDLSSRLLQTVEEAPVLICYPEDKPNAELEKLEGLGCELLPLPAAENSRTGVRPEPVLRQLAEREASRVLVEGGSEVLGAFFDEDLVDRAVIFCAPMVLGGAGAVTAVGGTGAGQVEEASMLRGDVFWGREMSELPAEPRVEVDISGRDVRISGWFSNPLNWGPEPYDDQTGYEEERE